MNLHAIKQKYKQILQEPQSEQSDDQWQMAYSRMKNKRRRHVLTESNCVNYENYSTKLHTDQAIVLKLKQKLAQCLNNIHKKDKEIADIKQMNFKINEQANGFQKQVFQLKQALAFQQKKIIQNKIAYGCIEKDYENLTKAIQSQKLDKQLLRKQTNFYEQEIQEYKLMLDKKDMKIQELSANIVKAQKHKNMNSRLKIDIARLRDLLSETQKYKMFASSIEYKSYLGKPCRQHECWYSQDLINQTENFIKKQQITSSLHSSKILITNLMSFINRYTEQAKKKVQKKTKKMCSSRIKQIQRKHNHSLNFMEIRQQTLKKSLLRTSMCKSRRTNLNQSKQCTQSFIYDRLQKSLVAHEINQNRDLCIQMLGSFRKGIIQLLSFKQIKRKKITKLVNWLVEGILSIFPKNRPVQEIPLESQQIKIVQ